MMPTTIPIHPHDWADPLARALLLDELRDDIGRALGRRVEPEELARSEIAFETIGYLPSDIRTTVSVRITPERGWIPVRVIRHGVG